MTHCELIGKVKGGIKSFKFRRLQLERSERSNFFSRMVSGVAVELHYDALLACTHAFLSLHS